MGKKDKSEEPKAVEVAKEDEEEEDTPVVKALKAIDDKYCEIESELELEIQKLRKKFDEQQAPLIEERRKVLSDEAAAENAEDKQFGTPACPDFWSIALSNHEDLTQCINDEADLPVLKYLEDIRKSEVDETCAMKGTRIEFVFKENPYFDNKVLSFEMHTDYDPKTYKPWKDLECISIKGCTIDWKAGKNVTVEKKAKETGKKGGKKRPAKKTEEPVPSIFRILFTTLNKDDPLPEGLECCYAEMEELDEDDELAEVHMGRMMDLASMLSEDFLPYAVRWFSGEAAPDDDDDDEESEEEDDDGDSEEDDDDDDDDSEDEKAALKMKSKKKGKDEGAKKGAGGEKTEECKQQ